MIRNEDTGNEGLCIEKVCSIPSALYDESDTAVNIIRKSIREGHLDRVLELDAISKNLGRDK